MAIMGSWRVWLRRRRLDASHDRRWVALARTLADVGFWSGLPPAKARAQQREVAAGAYPFTCAVLQNVTFFADGEELAEGCVEDLLREMAPALQYLGVALQVRTVSDGGSDEYVVDINGRRCLVLDADDWRYNSPWLQATARPLAVINDLLARAGTPVRVHTLYTGENEGLALLLDPAIVDAARDSGLIPGRDLPELPEHRLDG